MERTSIEGLILAVLSDDDADAVFEAMLDAEIFEEQLIESATALIAELTGYDKRWWVGYKLALIAGNTEVLGALVLKGVRAWDVSLGEWCAAAYALCTQNAKPEDKFKFDAQLDTPLPGYDAGDAWDDGMSLDEMVQMARSMPGMR